VWNYLMRAFQHPSLAELRAWYLANVPPPEVPEVPLHGEPPAELPHEPALQPMEAESQPAPDPATAPETDAGAPAQSESRSQP
jgi:hypothetical protein